MLKLEVCEGDYGLASVEPESLQLIFLSKLWKDQIKVSTSSWKSPVLTIDKREVKNIDEMLTILSKPVDEDLNQTERSYSFVVTNLMHQKVRPVIQYVFWLEQYNFDEFTSKWFSKAKNFLFNTIYMDYYRNKAKDNLNSIYPEKQYEDMRPELLKSFKEICHYFAMHLKNTNTDYFFGSKISSVDVLLYGYLYPLLKIPFPSNVFREVIKEFNVLEAYLNRIHASYFPDYKYEERYVKTKVNEDDFQKRTVILAGIVVTLLMTGYALSNGIIKIR